MRTFVSLPTLAVGSFVSHFCSFSIEVLQGVNLYKGTVRSIALGLCNMAGWSFTLCRCKHAEIGEHKPGIMYFFVGMPAHDHQQNRCCFLLFRCIQSWHSHWSWCGCDKKGLYIFLALWIGLFFVFEGQRKVLCQWNIWLEIYIFNSVYMNDI
jgi:hypothetical protein